MMKRIMIVLLALGLAAGLYAWLVPGLVGGQVAHLLRETTLADSRLRMEAAHRQHSSSHYHLAWQTSPHAPALRMEHRIDHGLPPFRAFHAITDIHLDAWRVKGVTRWSGLDHWRGDWETTPMRGMPTPSGEITWGQGEISLNWRGFGAPPRAFASQGELEMLGGTHRDQAWSLEKLRWRFASESQWRVAKLLVQTDAARVPWLPVLENSTTRITLGWQAPGLRAEPYLLRWEDMRWRQASDWLEGAGETTCRDSLLAWQDSSRWGECVARGDWLLSDGFVDAWIAARMPASSSSGRRMMKAALRVQQLIKAEGENWRVALEWRDNQLRIHGASYPLPMLLTLFGLAEKRIDRPG